MHKNKKYTYQLEIKINDIPTSNASSNNIE
jgi:hypothetical protein